MKRALLLTLILSPILAAAHSQDLVVDVNLTVLTAYVEDLNGHPIVDLDAGDFEIVENNHVRPIKHFLREQEPVALGLVVDRSSSVAPVKKEIDRAVAEVVKTLRPGDETFLLTFAETGRLRAAWTKRPEEILDSLQKTKFSFGSRVYDVIAQSLGELATGRVQKKALVIFTDGADHYSHLGFDDVLNASVLYGYPIYLVGFPGDDSRTWSEEGRRTIRNQFAQLAETTGGKSLFPASGIACSRFAKDVVNSLSVTYILGFYTSEPLTEMSDVHVRLRDGRLRNATVRISRVLPL